MTEVPPPPPPPGAAGGPPVRSPGVPPPPGGVTGSASATGGRRRGGVNRGLFIGIVAAIAAALGLGAVLALTDDGDDASGPEATTEMPEPSREPDGLGDDSELDALAQDCFAGQMDACDDLFIEAESGSEYERYGDTCAGRQEAHTGVLCTETFPD